MWNKIWYQNHPLKYCLLPISGLFCVLVFMRRLGYKMGWLRQYQPSLPVIVIGNISVGGTGKTPLIIYLARQFSRAGVKVAVVSRGYGRKEQAECEQVNPKGSTLQYGDEPMLIARQSHVPVFVARERTRAVQKIEQQKLAEVILCDDGLQHYALGRTVEWCVIDQQRGLGNGFCLPAGPLRESAARLKTVDLLIEQHGDKAFAKDEIAFYLQSQYVWKLNQPQQKKPLSGFNGQACSAIAGIANPQRFFSALRQQGLQVQCKAFADHYAYQQEDFKEFSNTILFMTEKDAIKCQQYNLPNAWVVAVECVASKALQQQVKSLIGRFR